MAIPAPYGEHSVHPADGCRYTLRSAVGTPYGWLSLHPTECGRSVAQIVADELYFVVGEQTAAVELPPAGRQSAIELGTATDPGRQATDGGTRSGIGEIATGQIDTFHTDGK